MQLPTIRAMTAVTESETVYPRIKTPLMERLRRVSRRVRANFPDYVINLLMGLGTLAAVATVVFLVLAGLAAEGAVYRAAGLDLWFALIAAGVCYTAIRVSFWMQRRLVLADQPSIHANDLPSV